MVELHLS
ncbi:hypothetical protein FWK35_00009070 [Aphis craccivora]|nr:hypothetical protein FWK35_00009070 [Aphis craccivora]